MKTNLLQSIINNAAGLGLFAVLTAGIIGVVQVATSTRIEQNIERAAARALNDIIPASEYDNDMLLDSLSLAEQFDVSLLGPIDSDAKVHFARNQQEITGIILPAVSAIGYSGDIKMLVGIEPNGEVIGVRVVEHRETPGLGDKIELKKSDWILSFDRRSLDNTAEARWTVKKEDGDFDQFTGATITPKAVISAVQQSLAFFAKYQTQLLSVPASASLNLTSLNGVDQ